MLLDQQPMSSRQLVVFALWFPAPILQTIVAVQMYRRRLAPEFRLFFYYLVFHVLRTVVLAATGFRHGSGGFAYFYIFWTTEILDIGLGMAVVYEIYSLVFRSYPALTSLGRTLFWWSVAVLLLIASVNASATPGTANSRFMAGLLVMDRSAGILRGGLLLLLFFFARALGLTWRHYMFGIAAGFTLNLGVELVGYTMVSQLGLIAAPTLVLVNLASYDCANLIWLAYFLQSERVLDIRTPLPQGNLDRWNQALAELVYRT